MIRTAIILLTILICASCNNEVTQKLEAKNKALGKMNQIVVVADKNIWEGAVGDTFRYYFESAYPIMPSPESIFDLKYYTPEEIQNVSIRREFRTYAILADLSNAESAATKMVKRDMGTEKFNAALKNGTPKTSVGKNKWARSQLLVYLFGSNHDSINVAIKKAFPAIARRVNKHDEKILEAQAYGVNTNLGLTNEIKETFDVNVAIPSDFKTAIKDTVNNVLWLRKNMKLADLNVVFRKVKYVDEEQVSKSSIIQMRNEFGSEYILSDEEDNVMVVNDEDLPVYEYSLTLGGRYAKELRGIWEMTKEFTGGPFCTYIIVNENKRELIYIDTFVLAPGIKKRDYMQQLDFIIKSGMQDS